MRLEKKKHRHDEAVRLDIRHHWGTPGAVETAEIQHHLGRNRHFFFALAGTHYQRYIDSRPGHTVHNYHTVCGMVWYVCSTDPSVTVYPCLCAAIGGTTVRYFLLVTVSYRKLLAGSEQYAVPDYCTSPRRLSRLADRFTAGAYAISRPGRPVRKALLQHNDPPIGPGL